MSSIVEFRGTDGASLNAKLYYDQHSNEFLVEDAETDVTVAVWDGITSGFTYIHSDIRWGSALARSIHEYLLLRGPRVMKAESVH